jgi:hypothetical protein
MDMDLLEGHQADENVEAITVFNVYSFCKSRNSLHVPRSLAYIILFDAFQQHRVSELLSAKDKTVDQRRIRISK